MKIRINVFQGMQNIPNLVAQEQGFFAQQGLEIETVYTKSSQAQRDALASGACDIAHSAVDNAFALVDAGVPIAIVVGLDHGFNKLVTRAGLTSYEDLRGKTVGVDAPDTAFALLAYDMLQRHGLKHGLDYSVNPVGATRFRLDALLKGEVDCAMLNLPFNLLAENAGCFVLDDPTSVVGSYQATSGFVLQAWAESNRDALVSYLRAYIQGLAWAREAGNRVALTRLCTQWFELAPDMAAKCLERVLDPRTGFAPDARLDREGLAETIRLRNAFEQGAAGAARDLFTCVDESFYQLACRPSV